MESLPIEQIELYLLDQLSADERRDFEERIQNNPDWAAQVEAHKTLIAGIQLQGQRKLKNRFAKLEEVAKTEEDTLKTSVRPFFRSYALLIAAGVALLIVGTWIVFQPKPVNPFENLINLHYESGIGTRGENDPCEPVVEAVVPYNKRAYLVAAKSLRQLLDTGLPTDCEISTSEIQLLLGVSTFLLADFELAAEILTTVSQIKDKQEAASRWYLALTYLKMEEWDKSEIELKWLVEKGGYYGEKAQALLEVIQ